MVPLLCSFYEWIFVCCFLCLAIFQNVQVYIDSYLEVYEKEVRLPQRRGSVKEICNGPSLQKQEVRSGRGRKESNDNATTCLPNHCANNKHYYKIETL